MSGVAIHNNDLADICELKSSQKRLLGRTWEGSGQRDCRGGNRMPWRMFVVGKSVVDPSTGETSATSGEHDSLYGGRTSACVHILSGYTRVRTEAPDGK